MKIVVDQREMRSGVAEALEKLGADVEITTLEVGDYVVSDRVAFERKTVDDLFATLLERQELFSQLMDLARSYRRPVLIIEGEDPFFFQAAGCTQRLYRASSILLHSCASRRSTRSTRQRQRRSSA